MDHFDESNSAKSSLGHYGINSALKIIPGNEIIACNLPFRLDTYMGCSHNCTYCYAKNLLARFKNKWKPEKPKPIDPDDLEKELRNAAKMKRRPKITHKLLKMKFPIRLGTNVDCFQPIERELGITEKVIRILNEWRYPYIINTKSDMVAKQPYLELIRDAPGGCILQFTILSLHQHIINKLEPGAPSVDKRIDAAEKLSNEGVYVQVRVSPVIPDLTSNPKEMEALFKELKAVGVKDIITEFLRYKGKIRECVKDAFNGEIDLDQIYKKHGCTTRSDGRPKGDRDGYVRVPMQAKFKLYKQYKEIAHRVGLNLYVCSEEYPEINGCVNCCGTSKHEITEKFSAFGLHNSVATNTIACFIKKKGKVTLRDLKQNFFCVDWDGYEKKWEHLDQLLVNVEKKVINSEIQHVYVRKLQI